MSELTKVQSGAPLRMRAQTFNALIDAARDFQDRQRRIGQDPGRVARDADIILMRNDTEQDVGRFAVLGIDGPIIDPADSEDGFAERIAVKGVVPDIEVHVGKFVITLEPVPAGGIGRACISGTCVARVDFDDPAAETAEIEDNEIQHLVSDDAGSVRILWKEEGDGLKWAIVRFGGAGGAAEPGIRWAIFDGQRWKDDLSGAATAGDSGHVYTGHFLDASGSGDASRPCQWKFPNDLAKHSLIPAAAYVALVRAPGHEQDDEDASWLDSETYGSRFWAILTPYAMFW